jgi:acyl transferase domain-containing protein/NAD(P)H-dependent flavin oxidoreductase YrpB (nitropropane dioxygenase family)/ABC-type nitrate/sulfonate/bicarbonate transport system substrate-binding protein/NAD(P)-dependent dehydrogenase (short-subunit alcohol dehydrogenase family)
MPRFQVIALTLPGMLNPAVAIAASRASGLGVLDLEYAKDKNLAADAIKKLSRYAKGDFGIKLDSADSKFFNEVINDLPASLKIVILTYSDAQKLRKQISALHQRKLTVLLETTSRERAEAGQALGVDGLIAKGHEAGGRIGEETTFILLQNLLGHTCLPIFAHGGVGEHTAAACHAAGAAGLVLDWQLALTKESPLPEAVKARIASMDGSETLCLGNSLGEGYRMYARPGLPVVARVQQAERELAEHESIEQSKVLARWRERVRRDVGCDSVDENLLLMSQDAAFAGPLAKKFVTTGGVLQEILRAIDSHCQAARRARPLDEDSPLARSHGTRYPIIQGAMTRVSDNAEFALAVADGGALPFLALALMRQADVEPLLAETKALLGDKPWGVGILGFVPLELRQEQMEALRAYRPPFALIAGGRPDQARALEKDGIATYLHVPSPRLLEMFLQDGATRFVFEGRECGGHVGPRTSFVLWEQMTEELLKFLPSKGSKAADEYHVVFAGGIHDALSASMVSAIAAPLADLGVRIGVSMGTGYIFTQEAVSTGAIVPGFQEEALKSQDTILFETGPGHAIRCANTPYKEAFDQEKQRLYAEGKPFEEVRTTLELMNLGRLRIASKGIAQNPDYRKNPHAPRFVTLSDEDQIHQGLYMIGQVAGLRHTLCTIEELHQSVTLEATRRLEEMVALQEPEIRAEEQLQPSDIAIVGMACLLPKAPNLQTYWENILNKVDAIAEIPKDRWDWELYYDPDRLAKDKIYSKWGGFLDEVHFDPLEYGIPPNSLRSIEPLHLLTLEVVRAALKDAGYLDRPFPRERTSVILGAGGGADLGGRYGFRSMLPYFLHGASNGSGEREKIVKELGELLPEWTEDSFAGILTNVAAGRVANRFNLGGRNFTVDAACAASLAAVDLAVKELEAGTSDMVIVGGADTMQSPFAYLCFSKTYALSPRGHCYTFDDSSDGIVISEGVAALILKRLADAERDGDRIYAVIKGVGGSSDGKDKGLTAPRPEGQMRALKRAYAKAHVSPATVELIEAHGTGTAVGDQAEIESLSRVFAEVGAARQSCGVGSVKSMIGHTKCTAGVASVIKIALALHHKVLPPTINVEKPNARVNFPETPFYVNTEARPWIKRHDDVPRRAGVSAFGFGGTNFHAVLEEYTGDYQGDSTKRGSYHWPSELFLWRAGSRQALVETIEPLEKALASATAKVELPDLAYTVHERYRQPLTEGDSPLHLAIVATSVQDLREKLARAREALSNPNSPQILDPRGIYFTEHPMMREGKVAFLFPGQGSQQPNMLKDLAFQFSEVRATLENANGVLKGVLERPLSSYIFPPPTFTKPEEEVARQALTDTRIAQPALGAIEMGLFHLLRALGVQPDFVAGHSYGEYVALCAAGVLNQEDFIRLSEARGRLIVEGAGAEPGAMAAIECDASTVHELIADLEGVGVANLNSPSQTIISGTRAAVETAVAKISAKRIKAKQIPVACAFHSPIMAPAQKPLAEFLSATKLRTPRISVFSNTTAAPYPKTLKAMANQLVEHLVRPVKFLPQVEALYDAGARVFVEVGPGAVLTNRVGEILAERPHFRVASDQPGRSSLVQLHHLLGQLAMHGLPVQLDPMFNGREVEKVDLKASATATNEGSRSPITWLVNGTRAKPLAEAVTSKATPQPKPADLTVDSRPSAPAADTQPKRIAPRRLLGSSAPKATAERTETLAAAPQTVSPHTDQKVERERPAASASAHLAPQSAPSTSPLYMQGQIPPVAQPASQSDVVQVMSGFQDLMRRFLDTQRSVMQVFLQGNADGAVPSAEQQFSFPRQQIEGVQASPLPSAQPPQAAALQRVQAMTLPPLRGDPSPEYGTPLPQAVIPAYVPEEQKPGIELSAKEEPAESGLVPKAGISMTEAPAIPDREELTARLVAIVSERTGYPAEMLDLDLDLEADLGIDSIKRIEILGNYQKAFDFTASEDIAAIMEELAKIKTLRGVIEWVDTRLRTVLTGQPEDKDLWARMASKWIGEETLPLDLAQEAARSRASKQTANPRIIAPSILLYDKFLVEAGIWPERLQVEDILDFRFYDAVVRQEAPQGEAEELIAQAILARPAKLAIGCVPFMNMIQLAVADEKGWFRKELGMEIEYVRFTSGVQMLEAVAAGRLDVAYIGTGPAITAAHQGLPVKVVATCSKDAFAFLAIDTFADIYAEHPTAAAFAEFATQQGRKLKIATVPWGTTADMFLRYWLVGLGVDPEQDVDIVPMDADQLVAATTAGQADAAVYAEPHLTLIQRSNPRFKVVLWGDELTPDLIAGVVMVQQSIIDQYPEMVQKLVEIHIRATKHLGAQGEGELGKLSEASAEEDTEDPIQRYAPISAARPWPEGSEPRALVPGRPAASGEEDAEDVIQRFTLTSAARPLPEGNAPKALAPGRVVVLTDDENGVAQSLAAALQNQGHAVALVRVGEQSEAATPGMYSADLTSHEAVVKLLDLIRQRQGPVGGLVHLMPLKDHSAFEPADDGGSYDRTQREVKSLFYLTKEASKDLKEAAKEGGACVIAATGMGGTFGSVGSHGEPSFFPGHGAVAGLVKSVAREWPAVRAKVVDTDPLESPADLATKVLQEMMAGDGEVEIGYHGSRRLVLRPTLSQVDRDQSPALRIDPASVILVTGGARGITAEVARELSERYQPTLLLVGRTPLPPPDESPETQELDSPRELKAAIMEQMRDRGAAITPAKVEAAYNQLLKEREIRENLRAMQSAGATVRYRQIDVCDEQAFGDLIDEIYRDYGRLDGVIHGAGIVEDKFIEDKTPDSFDRVFDTKVRSALLLTRKLQLDELSFLIFFSSISGRFGNRGQCDYAAANEVLNKLALYLDRHCPGRVISISWGPWESGMVSPELQKQFAQRGVVIVPRSVGRKKMDQELRWGRKGEVEILLGGIEDGRLSTPPEPETTPSGRIRGFPFISTGANLSQLPDGSMEILRTLDPAQDLYLNDHRLDGKAVLPMAMALELMAEAASAGWPDLEVVEMKDLRLLRGLVLEDGPKPVRIVAKPLTHPSRDGLEVEVSIVGTEPRTPFYYMATARLDRGLPTPPSMEALSLVDEVSLPLTLEEVYRQWLFHGPLMAGIAEIKGIGANGITGYLTPSAPEKCLVGAPQRPWIIDPIVLDSALQLVIVWSRIHWDMTPLPARLHTYRRFGSLSGSQINCQMSIRPDSAGHIVHCYTAFFRNDGQLLGLLDDAEGVCSKALNRLAQMKDKHE